MPPRSNHYGQPGRSITGQQRADIVAWIQEGLPRNEIARRAKRSGSTISGIAKAEGLEFGQRTRVAAATQARTVDNRARRAELAAKLLDKANQALEEMDKPHLAFAFGGKDNIYREHKLPAPPTADKRNLMQIASTALGRHMDLERHDADQAATNAKSMLTELGKALGVQAPDPAA